MQCELASLVDAGLVSVRKQGNQRHYQADASAPMFAELRGLVLKTMGLADVFGALESASATLGRSINPAIYTPDDFARRVAQDNAFISRVMQQPKIGLIGHESLNHESSP